MPTLLGDREACPQCSSTEIAEYWPRVPDLWEDPELALIYIVDQHIPRDERGVLMPRELVAWLRLHGVRDRVEILHWERWLGLLGSIRARHQELAYDQPRDDRREENDDA